MGLIRQRDGPAPNFALVQRDRKIAKQVRSRSIDKESRCY